MVRVPDASGVLTGKVNEKTVFDKNDKSLGQEQKNREVFLTVREFHEYVKRNLDYVGLDPSFLSRYLNEGFSANCTQYTINLIFSIIHESLSDPQIR